jgi:hypothetical protein
LTDIERTHAAVSGLAVTISVKFRGVITSASRLDTAEMESESARLPRPKAVTTFDSAPPGQAATSIIAASVAGGRSSTMVSSQVAPGSSTNCAARPMPTASGWRAT